MKFHLIVICAALLMFAFAAQPALAAGKVKFGGNLDRPTSTKDADEKESPDAKDEPPVPEEPEDEEEEEPPEFMDEELEGDSFILVLDKSGSMAWSFPSCGFPVSDRNGNTIPSPNRWQATQSETANCLNAMTEEDTFDIITYATQVFICFSSLKVANPGNKGTAIGWIYNQNAVGATNSYDGLKAAYLNYGQFDTCLFMSDGEPNTALSIGCPSMGCASWIGARIISDMRGWMGRQIALYAGHKLFVIQVSGSPMSFMVNLGALPNAEFSLK